jgi:hypothetical protein
MTVPDTRGPFALRTVPQPRAPQDDPPAEPVTTTPDAAPQENAVPQVASYPWPEPWRHSRAARPRSEFWDVATASWHSRGPSPTAEQG